MTTECIITLKNENEMLRLTGIELLYVEVQGKILTCKTEDDAVFHCTMTLNNLEEKLPEYFLRISRNCLINAKRIKRYHRRKKLVTLSDASEHKISERRVKMLIQYLEGGGVENKLNKD